ncbi:MULTISPECIES: hypothetical protein [Mycolicibacterium]|jgi:hypothetical protein|uniref:hypothetical protein n=1 Tax=Mycolicibacterium TaxID=1866885 RepID=UPI00059E6E02|nr:MULTISPECIES: hypothetical protein [Mycolicibacterium]MCV7130711.1 hypothetical protein [Mycolicibacterium vanbaalenii PYR-1]PQP50170.1 hypothetical protein C6A88_10520 [Mycolicibacterium austroafricanum]QZT62977.1 hypothetical protein JN085_00725 [Mycolicibacterium austroafricanum]UJL29992.1 hypothetical protein HZU38_05700 [Mycolicibacterium vanbaalenii]WND56943.1 hypothetical protein QQA43_00575 [Mycolicibacterium vanbaalenii]
MNPQTHVGNRPTAFWAAATIGVPVLLSAALLLTLVLEMSITAADLHHMTSRFIAIAIVEVLLTVGSVWGTRKSTAVGAGTAVAAAIVGIILVAGAVLTL